MTARDREDVDALLSGYLDGELDAALRHAVEARLQAEPALRERLEVLRAADARLRASSIPDPGPAYWRDFTARVDARIAPREPARIYEKLVAWFVDGGRVHWIRAAGALAGLTLVTYVGMRGFRPAEIAMRDRAADEVAPPVIDASRPADASRPSETPPTVDAPPPADAPQKPESSPQIRGGRSEKGGAKLTIERAPAETEVADREVAREPEASPRAPVLMDKPEGAAGVGAVTEALESKAEARQAEVAADSIATYLAMALQARDLDDLALRAPESESLQALETKQQLDTKARSLNKGAALRNDTALAPIQPPAAPAAGAIDRLLELADIAEPRLDDPRIRPHAAAIARRLAAHASTDRRAGERAADLMRTLAATSTTPSERAQWEESLRQLPP
jgi:hypothetical protein